MMTHYIANEFTAKGHGVRILAPSDALLPEEFTARYELVVDEPARPERRETRRYRHEIARISDLLAGLDRDERIDHVLVMHVFYYGPGVRAFCESCDRSYSVFIHGFEFRSQLLKKPKISERLGIGRLAYLDLRHSTIDLVRSARNVFTNSSATNDVLQQVRVDGHVVGCGLSRDVIAERRMSGKEKREALEDHRRTLGLPPEAKIICFLGRLAASKNPSWLIELLKCLPDDVVLAIAGAGDRVPLEQMAISTGVSERVHFFGPVSEEIKWALLAAVDILCLPSKYLPEGQMEGFGIVLLEAALCATPVVATPTGGMRDVLLDHNGLIVDLDDLAEAGSAIERLLSDQALQDKLVGNARQLIDEELNYDRICDRMLWEIQKS